MTWCGRRSAKRTAAAVVEMALITPLMLVLLFGIIEFGWMYMARALVHRAAAEACRLAILPGYEGEEQGAPGSAGTPIQTRINEILAPLGDVTVVWTRTAAGGGNPNEAIRVRVPLADVALPGFVLKMFFDIEGQGGSQIDFTVTMANPQHQVAS
jgi:hypothetical protein